MHKFKYYYLLTTFILLPMLSIGQSLKGVVYEEGEGGKKLPLFGATLNWQGTNKGTTTDEKGRFKLDVIDTAGANLIIRYIGYENDTLFIKNQEEITITLSRGYQIKEVVVVKEKSATYISRINPAHQEIIGQKELLRAACCNLSESFETNASVDVNFTDAVTGAKQIRMLGLDGVYTQTLIENMPNLRGLASTYGLSYIPGTWIQSIQVTKGAGSVVNGYESMAGQINLELIKPEAKEKLYFNLYGDQMGRTEANLNLTHKLNNKLGTVLLLHGDGLFRKADLNNDRFLDNPLGRQFSFSNRWTYFDGKKIEGQLGVNGTWQNRQGGQIHFGPATDKGTTNAYGIGIDTRRLEAYGKLGLVFPDKPYKSFGSMYSATNHRQRNYYGLNTYDGDQNTLYANLIYQSIVGNTNHKFKTGVSMLFDDYQESFNDSAFSRQEVVPGVFGEYTYSHLEDFSFVAGLRADYHNLFGLMITPRVHTRYALTKNTTLRLSAGKGYRTPNMWVENSAIWASSRKIVIAEAPDQEVSWNYGGSLLQNFKVKKKEGYISADFFRTEFQSQYIADLDLDPQKVVFSNLKGRSYANSLQVEAGYEPVKKLNLKTAYKWYNVMSTYHGQLMEKPLVPANRFLVTASYTTKYDKWMIDATGLRYGQSRLPNTASNPESFRKADYSPAYWVFHLQLTRNFKRWSLYGGSENIFNFRQPNPIVSVDDPFGPYFDASMIWGPVEGRRIYAGLRYKIDNPKN